MEPCSNIRGNADMYGLGIRLGFYLQWLARIVTDSLLVVSKLRDSDLRSNSMKNEVQGGRFGLQCFIGATFIAVIHRVSTGQESGTASTTLDLYISLLICFGCYLFVVPTFIWRIITGFDPLRDPTRWSAVPGSLTYRVINHLMLMASASFQVWFWSTWVPKERPDNCELVGFLFSKQPLGNSAMRGVNIAVQVFLLTIGLANPILLPFYRNAKDEKVVVPKTRGLILQLLNKLIALAIFSVTVVAIELTIIWNGLNSEDSDMYAVYSAGQLIPLVIGAFIFLRIIYKYIFPDAAQQRALSPWTLESPKPPGQGLAQFDVSQPLSMNGFFRAHQALSRSLEADF